MLEFEQKYYDKGKKLIVGIDEVGRGPLCGPVVAASVILPQSIDMPGVTDSKKLTPKKRDILYKEIKKKALHVGVGIVHEDKIDEINILEATMQAMRDSIKDLKISPDVLLVDGNIKPLTDIEQESIIKGDSKSISIAAASIIAKVTRDRMMAQYDLIYPGYGLARNMGYGTKEHMTGIKEKFSTPIHRKSFKPTSDFLPTFNDIKDFNKLSIQIAATDLVKKGHEIHSIFNNEIETIDIFSSYNDRYYSFAVDDKTIEIDAKGMEIEGEKLIKTIKGKKDITSSINMSVISVQFSKDKPVINYKNL